MSVRNEGSHLLNEGNWPYATERGRSHEYKKHKHGASPDKTLYPFVRRFSLPPSLPLRTQVLGFLYASRGG